MTNVISETQKRGDYQMIQESTTLKLQTDCQTRMAKWTINPIPSPAPATILHWNGIAARLGMLLPVGLQDGNKPMNIVGLHVCSTDEHTLHMYREEWVDGKAIGPVRCSSCPSHKQTKYHPYRQN